MKSTDVFWDQVKVIDATEPITISPKLCDLEGAISGDPEQCVYARCFRRVLKGVRRIRIFRTTAFLESRDKDGNTIAYRYFISQEGERALRLFDQGLGILKSCTFRPPAASQKRERQRERWHEHHKRDLEGRSKPRGKYIKKPEDYFIRSGIGQSCGLKKQG